MPGQKNSSKLKAVFKGTYLSGHEQLMKLMIDDNR